MRPVALAGILASTTILTGCAGTIAGVSLSSISSFAGFASTLFTGADLGEHAVSLVTGKDCRFSEGLMREDRDVCEEPGSAATRDDFHGIFVERIDPDGTVIFAAPKYMSASVGAGENENDPDQIWTEIKSQKAREESERQLARAQATQTIDVAALATGSLSTESLAFLPATTTAAELSDGDTASQTAASERPVVNAASPVNAAKPAPKRDAPKTVDVPLDEPAIDEAALTVPLKAARENGQGGPLIATTSSGAPVVSKLVNGEPVVILRLGPIFGGVTPSADTASAEPTAAVVDERIAAAATNPLFRPVSAPSPQAILRQSRPAAPEIALAATEAKMAPARPRIKPTAAELATQAAAEKAIVEKAAVEKVATEKVAVKAKPARKTDEADVYQPPEQLGEDIYASTTPDLTATAPVQLPDDVAATTYTPPATGETVPPAAIAPAPLFPIAQP
jgi:hypothetical protein